MYGVARTGHVGPVPGGLVLGVVCSGYGDGGFGIEAGTRWIGLWWLHRPPTPIWTSGFTYWVRGPGTPFGVPVPGPRIIGWRFSNLTIWKTIQEDEGTYHCALITWNKNTWRGTYLLIKGNTVGTSNYTVIQRPAIRDPVHVGDLLTLQCLVLSDADNKTCSGHLNLFWQRCVCKFSKTINTSDAGTYYCAVAIFGNIIFGNGTKVDVESTWESKFIELVITITCLVISVIINITFICCQTPRSLCKLLKGKEASFSQAKQATFSQSAVFTKEEDTDLNYAALHFSGAKNTRGKAKRTTKNEESVYSQINL
ncbi:uncharacterized protein LOC105924020 [Fundulus heteroclitus]|uniref:uncharacterized protein LOC105924020 n=1 Tax=Fundulus heteroclitus TaxID=8078 RepID=UPI00165C5A8E|nr:uncharacterized protein LOC105924020 [Fundulus heteroclitus]